MRTRRWNCVPNCVQNFKKNYSTCFKINVLLEIKFYFIVSNFLQFSINIYYVFFNFSPLSLFISPISHSLHYKLYINKIFFLILKSLLFVLHVKSHLFWKVMNKFFIKILHNPVFTHVGHITWYGVNSLRWTVPYCLHGHRIGAPNCVYFCFKFWIF